MKRIVGFIVFFIFIISVASVLPWNPYKKMTLPEFYANETSIAILADSLKSSDEGARIYAAVRLGQLKDPSAIAALEDAYEAEPHYSLIDHGNGVKYYALVSIATIGGREAMHFIEELAAKLMAPNVAAAYSPHYIHFGDTLEIFSGLSEAMAATNESRFSNMLLGLFDNPQIDAHLREISYRSYLKMVLNDTELTTFEDSLRFLLDQKKQVAGSSRFDSSGARTAESLKNDALFSLLIKFGKIDPAVIQTYKSTLPAQDPFIAELDSLRSILDVIVENERRANPNN